MHTCSRSILRARPTTLSPFLTNSLAMAAPIPELAPVTAATRPTHRSIVEELQRLCCLVQPRLCPTRMRCVRRILGNKVRGGERRLLLGNFRSGHVVLLSRKCFQTISTVRTTQFLWPNRKMLQHCTAQCGTLPHDHQTIPEVFREWLLQATCCIHTSLFPTNCTTGFIALTCFGCKTLSSSGCHKC